MDPNLCSLAPETLIPDHFMPAIGLVMVTHAHMDAQLQNAIGLMSGMGYNSVVSVLAEVTSTGTRAAIFQNLARTAEHDLNVLCKMLVVGDVIVSVSRERNVIAHGTPYWYTPSKDPSDPTKDQIGYFKEVNKTVPQIKQQAPYVADLKSLGTLANQIRLAAGCLYGLQKNNLSGNNDLSAMAPDERIAYIRANATRSPRWTDDAHFPWPDKLKRKIESESKKPQNSQRIQAAPANSIGRPS